MNYHNSKKLKPETVRRLKTLEWEINGDYAVCDNPPDILDRDFYDELENIGIDGAFEVTRLQIPVSLMNLYVPGWHIEKPGLITEAGEIVPDNDAAETAKRYLNGLKWKRPDVAAPFLTITSSPEQAELTMHCLNTLKIDYVTGRIGDAFSVAVATEAIKAVKGLNFEFSRIPKGPDNSGIGR